ncbi:hypothetical protein [Hymenobacter latericus]|uniref:hypothetical protein n=1 Tax=Hymenobacter sp. YIM 151858-1 TaxID=2987688 RepID=UPI0022270539|nr:hypothetical protein [Hymenobacter sp. YIM 151858-1]UYZ60100.1 hypothetical protein OIS50_04690 [Hymenobacter sp. YIM 151858-1]
MADYPFIARPETDRLDVLAAEVHRIVAGGNVSADSPVDRRECRLAVQHAYDARKQDVAKYNADRLQKDFTDRLAADKAIYFENLDAIYKFDGTADAWVQTWDNWPVHTNDDGEYYCLLPQEFVAIRRYQNLPGEELVRMAEPQKVVDRTRRQYLPLRHGQAAAWQTLYGSMEGNYGFHREGDRLVLTYALGSAPPPDKVLRLQAVIRPKSDTLPEPGLLEAMNEEDILRRAVAIVTRTRAEDKINDNNANLA